MIDVILLTGFLGSGKTTCLNRLLQRLSGRYSRIAVVMNEFGSIGIDGRLVEDPGHLVELENGSIFCVCIRENFLAAMAKLAQEFQPEVVIIEATGVADPLEMGDFLAYPGLRDVYRLHRTVTLVDALNFPKVIQTLRAARAQAQAADVFLMTKTDLVDHRADTLLEELLLGINPYALRFNAPFCQLSDEEWDVILGATGVEQEYTPGSRHAERATPPARDPMTSVTVALAPFATAEMAKSTIVASLPSNALRAKGFIDVAGQTHLFQYTLGEAECVLWAEPVETTGEIVIIGLNLERHQIKL